MSLASSSNKELVEINRLEVTHGVGGRCERDTFIKRVGGGVRYNYTYECVKCLVAIQL